MSSFKFIAASLATVILSLAHQSAQAAEMTISGTPATTAIVGQVYRFKPQVENANMSALEFNYSNLPAFSKSYRSSGLIMGVPTEPAVYTNVQIGAWDGAHYVVSKPFTLTVLAAPGATPTASTASSGGATVAEPVDGNSASGVAHLTWSKPVTNADGTLLTNLSGYLIRYGTSAASLTQQVKILANATEAEIENLAPGHWYFEIASLNSSNVTSTFSQIIGSVID